MTLLDVFQHSFGIINNSSFDFELKIMIKHMGEVNKSQLINWTALHREEGKRGLLNSLIVSI